MAFYTIFFFYYYNFLSHNYDLVSHNFYVFILNCDLSHIFYFYIIILIGQTMICFLCGGNGLVHVMHTTFLPEQSTLSLKSRKPFISVSLTSISSGWQSKVWDDAETEDHYLHCMLLDRGRTVVFSIYWCCINSWKQIIYILHTISQIDSTDTHSET